MRRITLILALGAALALSLPGVAGAEPAIDQYVEQVPGAGGDKPSKGKGGKRGGKGGRGGGSSATISPSEIAALESSGGADGTAAAELAAATAPTLGEGVDYGLSLLAAEVGSGQRLSELYDSRQEAIRELTKLLRDAGLGPRVARKAARKFTSQYWSAAVPDGSAASADDESPLSAVFSAVTGGGSGGMGPLLPVILIGVLVSALALTALSRRTSTGRGAGDSAG